MLLQKSRKEASKLRPSMGPLTLSSSVWPPTSVQQPQADGPSQNQDSAIFLLLPALGILTLWDPLSIHQAWTPPKFQGPPLTNRGGNRWKKLPLSPLGGGGAALCQLRHPPCFSCPSSPRPCSMGSPPSSSLPTHHSLRICLWGSLGEGQVLKRNNQSSRMARGLNWVVK